MEAGKPQPSARCIFRLRSAHFSWFDRVYKFRARLSQFCFLFGAESSHIVATLIEFPLLLLLDYYYDYYYYYYYCCVLMVFDGNVSAVGSGNSPAMKLTHFIANFISAGWIFHVFLQLNINIWIGVWTLPRGFTDRTHPPCWLNPNRWILSSVQRGGSQRHLAAAGGSAWLSDESGSISAGGKILSILRNTDQKKWKIMLIVININRNIN